MPDREHRDYITIFYYGTFLPVANGGNTRMVDMLERLHDDFERIILYCYSNHPHAPWTETAQKDFVARWPRIELVLEPYSKLQRIVTRCKNLLVTILPQLAGPIVAFRAPGTTPRLDAVKRRSRVICLSYTEALTQINGVDPTLCLVETHDLNFLKWSKIHEKSPYSLPALRKFRSEMALLETAGTVLAISPVEFSFFRMMLRTPWLVYLPKWNKGQAEVATARVEHDYDLIFVGSDYIMNIRGLCDLLNRHGTWLSRWRIAVCGRVCNHPLVREAARQHPNVELLGYVDDIENVYRRSRAALSPVDGTGTKMKLLAALGFGLPVFGSQQSRDGLAPGFEDAVFPIAEHVMRRVLDHPDHLASASRAARVYHGSINMNGDTEAVISAIRKRVPTNSAAERVLVHSA